MFHFIQVGEVDYELAVSTSLSIRSVICEFEESFRAQKPDIPGEYVS